MSTAPALAASPEVTPSGGDASAPVGANVPRVDGWAKVTGRACYPADEIAANALWAFTVFTNQPHARLLHLDTSAAEAAPGVVGVLTAADVPVNSYGLTLHDQPVLIGPPEFSHPEGPTCDVSRWEADHLAVVIARSLPEARAAAQRIDARWEQLGLICDLDAALAAEQAGTAPLLHAYNGLGSNVYERRRTRMGDMAAGWAQAAAVVEETYHLPHQEHAYLQPEAGTATVGDDGRMTVRVAGQWVHEDRAQIARVLDVAEDDVQVVYPAIGGAFGGREDVSLQIVLALGARWLKQRGIHRQLAARWSREESIVGHHKRHRAQVTARWGADGEGNVTAFQATAWLDAGAYNYTSNKVLGNLHLGLAGPYEVRAAEVDSAAVYTTSVPGGAFRGFGAPQATFVAEGQMDRLAAALGLDPIAMRRRNLLQGDAVGLTNTPFPPPVTLLEVFDAAVEARGEHPADTAGDTADNAATAEGRTDTAASPDSPPNSRVQSHISFEGGANPLSPAAASARVLRRGAAGFSGVRTLAPPTGSLRYGRGVACAFKNVGFSFGFPERCEATIVAYGDADAEVPELIELFHAGADVGQGAHTAFIQMAAEAAGVAPDQVRAAFSDSDTSGDSGSASASRLTWMGGNSILGAWEETEKAWREGARPARGHFRYTPPPTTAADPETGECVPNFAYGYVAQCVDVTVDIGTGQICVDRVVSSHDVGKAVNPLLVIGQIEGAVVQAHGYALSEQLQLADGRVTTPRLSSYLVPGIGDVPREIRSVVLELADPRGPFGVRGMSEMALLPYAPAVAAALFDATGVWVNEIPLTPPRVLAALTAAGVSR